MNFNWIKEYIKEGTTESSMRLVMVWAMVIEAWMFLTIGIHILAYKDLNWVGMGAFVVALGGFIGAFLYFKKEQKKLENK